jgi:putative flippase GtrA
LVYTRAMADILPRLAPFALVAVGVVLLLGLINMMRGGSSNRSQLLMRWRVILQFIAIIVVMAALYITQMVRSGSGG